MYALCIFEKMSNYLKYWWKLKSVVNVQMVLQIPLNCVSYTHTAYTHTHTHTKLWRKLHKCKKKKKSESHLKIDICETDFPREKRNTFSVVLSISAIDPYCSLSSHSFLQVNTLRT